MISSSPCSSLGAPPALTGAAHRGLEETFMPDPLQTPVTSDYLHPVAALSLTIELDRETDSRWIADIPALPGVVAYGSTPEEASARARALALRVIADEIEHGERTDEELVVSFVRAAA